VYLYVCFHGLTSCTRQVLKSKFVRDHWIEISIHCAQNLKDKRREFLLRCAKVMFAANANRTRVLLQDIFDQAQRDMTLEVSIIFNPRYSTTNTT
jgi:hypothetical protein